MAIVETWKQHVGVGVTQSLGASITIGMEMIVVPSINVVKRGVLIGSVMKLGDGSNGILVVRNLNQSLALLATTTGIVGIPQMVFNNPITIIHVNMNVD
jgi:hypothetical protein